MPNLPNENENFIRGLSDFWVRFFNDTKEIEAFMDATHIQIGQIYLELLQSVLGTSLQHIPLFSKRYYQLFLIREDQVAYVEGPSTSEDRFIYTPIEAFAEVPVLMNRVIAPTAVLDEVADYDVADGGIRFVRDPFNYTTVDETIPRFPVRSIDVTTPADLVQLHQLDWKTLGVRPGDNLRTRFDEGQYINVPITAIIKDRLILKEAPTDLHTDFFENFSARLMDLTYLRTPWDHSKAGVAFDQKITEVARFGLFGMLGATVTGVDNAELISFSITGPTTIQSSDATAAWVGRYILVRDPVTPANDGIFLVTTVVGTLVTLVAAFTAVSGPLSGFLGDLPGPGGVGHFLFLNDTPPENNGYFKIIGFLGATYTVIVTTPLASSVSGKAYRVEFSNLFPLVATFPLPNQEIVPGTFIVSARRLVERVINGVTYPVGEAVLEGVDYTVNYEQGTLTYLSIWDPLFSPQLSFEWRISIYRETFVFRGNWQVGTSYPYGHIVREGGRLWIANVPATTAAFFIPTEWVAHQVPFHFDEVFPMREIPAWAADVQVNQEALYNNFGYLLSYQRPTSEQYREFLRGVSQLFLLGPSIERFESALNVMAFFPVIREDGEILQTYEDGFEVLGGLSLEALTGSTEVGDRGEIVDSNYGNDGVLVNATSSFTINDPSFFGNWSAVLSYLVGDRVFQVGKRWEARVNATVGVFIETEWIELPPLFFTPSDVGAVIETRTPSGTIQNYTVTSISADGFTATVTPVPPDGVNIFWSYAHNIIRKRFVIRSADVTFVLTSDDVGSYVKVTRAHEDRNQQTFRIAAVEGPRTVYLDADYSLIDEAGLEFQISRDPVQRIETNRHLYELPLGVPVRDTITNPNNLGVYVFHSFEPISDAIAVIDYISDPTWWHNVTIPKEVLQLVPEVPLRRQVTPLLVEHAINALDAAIFNDFGMMTSADDEGVPGISRTGPATWLGGPWLALGFSATTPKASPNDVGRYVHVDIPDFRGDFQILEVSTDGLSLKLDRFPPPEASVYVPPVAFATVSLPPLLFRRTVAFIMMDRFLKYHAFKIEFRSKELLSTQFMGDAITLVKQAKPSHTFVYLEPLTSFVDVFQLREHLAIAYGPTIEEILRGIENSLTFMTDMLVNEYFSYHRFTQVGALIGGDESIILAPVFPFVPDRSRLVFARFTAGTAAGRPLGEGFNYKVDYATKQIDITGGDAGAYTLEYVAVALRIPGVLPVPWWVGVNSNSVGAWYAETPTCVNGPDPLIRINLGMLAYYNQGIIDRNVQIGIT